MNLGDMMVRVGANISGFESAMGTVSQRLSAIDRDASKAFSGFDKIGARLTDVGRTLSVALTLPLAAAGVAVTKMAADFDQGMRKVSSLIDDVTEQDFKNLSKQVLQLSRDLGIDAVKATDALYLALSSGIPKDNAVDFLRISSIAAIAGMTDTKVAVDGLTTVLQAYNLDASETRAVSDAMFAAVKIGKLEFPELAASIGIAAGTAKLLGISYQELLAAGATLTNTTGQAIPEAMTMLASAMKALIDPSNEMKELLKKFSTESGVATIKTLGFEVTLQKLWEASGKNVEVFEKAFGRIEGFRAAVGLTGDNAARTAKELEYLGHASDGVGQAQMAANEINKGATRQWEKALAQIKATGIEMGTTLLPAISNLLKASEPLLKMLAGAVDWFAKLSPEIQIAMLAFVSAVAVIGPLTLVLGGLLSAVSAISTAFVSFGGVLTATGLTAGLTALPGMIANISTAITGNMVGALTSGETMLLRMGQAAVVAAAAFAAWKLGQWAYDNIPGVQKLGDALGGLLLKLPGVDALMTAITNRTSGLSAANESAAAAVKSLEAALKRKGIEIDKTGKSADEYAAALTKAAKDNGALSTAATKVTKAVLPQEKAISGAEKALKALKDSAEKAKESYDRIARAFNVGKASAEQLEAAQIKLRKAQDNLDPQKVLERSEKAWQEWADRTDKNITDYIALCVKFNQISKEVEKSATDLALTFGKAAEDMRKEGLKEIKITATLDQRFPQAINDAIRDTRIFKEDLKTLGIEHVRHADTAIAAYERIRDSGKATATELLRAEKAMLDAVLQERRANGEQIAAADLKRLDEVEKKLKIHAGAWEGLGKEVSTIITNFTQDIARSLFEGDMSWGEKVKKMLTSIGEAVVSMFIQPAVKAISEFIAGTLADLLSGKGFGGVLGHLKEIGSSVAGIFGAGANVAGGAINAAGGIAGATAGQLGQIGGIAGSLGSAGSSAGAAAGQAAGAGLSATVGMLTGAASAISGVIGNFQFMAMNKSLDLIEKSTRYTSIGMEYQNKRVDEFWPKLKDIWDYLWTTQIQALNNFTAIMEDNLAFRLVEIRDEVRAVGATLAMAPSAPSIVIQNNTFRDRDDIDYIIEKIGVRVRETGQTI